MLWVSLVGSATTITRQKSTTAKLWQIVLDSTEKLKTTSKSEAESIKLNCWPTATNWASAVARCSRVYYEWISVKRILIEILWMFDECAKPNRWTLSLIRFPLLQFFIIILPDLGENVTIFLPPVDACARAWCNEMDFYLRPSAQIGFYFHFFFFEFNPTGWWKIKAIRRFDGGSLTEWRRINHSKQTQFLPAPPASTTEMDDPF